MGWNRRQVLMGSAGLATAAYLGGTGRSSAQSVLHLAHSGEPVSIWQESSQRFADDVAKKTEDRVKIEIHPSSSLGPLPAQAEGVQMGMVDMSINFSGILANWAPELNLFGLPFLFKDFQSANKAFEGEIEDWRRDVIRQKCGAELLASCTSGFKTTLTRTRQINTPDDLKGMRLRVPEIPISIETFKALGANVSPIAWAETYMALQTGVVDGVEAATVTLLNARFNEVTKFASRTNHMILDFSVIMNPGKLEALQPGDQDALRQAATDHFKTWASQQFIEAEDKAWQDMTANLDRNDTPDLAAFEAAVRPVVENFVKDHDLSGIYDKIAG
jgi:tripartite ATP-independent transporter DctP family solute receptor